MANPMYGQNKFDDKLGVKGKLKKDGGIPVQDQYGIAPVGGVIQPPYGYSGGVISGDGITLADADPYAESATQLFPLGTILNYGDRVYRYAFFNGAVTAGKLVQQPANIVANHTQMSLTSAVAASTGDTTEISIETAGDTDLTLNQYQDGYLIVNDGTGQGQSWRIHSHPAHNHGDDPTCVITVYGKVKTALVGSGTSQVSLTANPYKDVIVAPAAETGMVVGATNIDMTDDYYGWIQTKGPKAMLAGETLVLGHQLMRSDADAGAVMPNNSDDLCQLVGEVMASTVVDTEYCLVNLDI